MSGPHRLPDSAPARFGSRIDRAEPVGFRYGGRVMGGLYGDTAASALLAAGLTLFGRSAVLGRPRGLMALGADDPCGRVALDGDSGPDAGLPPGDVTLREGLALLAADDADALGRALARAGGAVRRPAGRLLPAPVRLVERLRRRLPMPAVLSMAKPPPVPARRDVCDVLVVGAGLAGLAAATAARAAGLDVRMVEASPRIGGAADLYEGTIDGRTLADWARDRAADLGDHAPDAVILRATAIGVDADGGVTVIERPDAAHPGRVAVRMIAASAVVLACGFRERPLAFADNDRPGILFAGAARALLRRYAVAPGARVVVATTGDEGYRTAIDLRQAGVEVELLLDARADPRGPAVASARAEGVPIRLSSVVTGVDFSESDGRILGVFAADLHGGGRLFADALVVAGGLAPRDELARGCGLGEDRGVFAAQLGPNAVEAVAGGVAAGLAAAAFAGAAADVMVSSPRVAAPADDAAASPAVYLDRLGGAAARTAFVDFGADVTVADLSAALARGGAGTDALARRLGLGRGADGGRLGADLAAACYAALAGERGVFSHPQPALPTLRALASRAGATEV